jgi:hypothetical protein
MTDRELLMGIVTAWTDGEARKHRCIGGAAVERCVDRDGYVVRLRPWEMVEVYIPHEDIGDESKVRAVVASAASALRESL